MWKSYIQGLLDYGSQIWAPIQISQLQKLELLQKSFTNRISDLQNKNYWEKLKCLKIYSVERRFQRYAVIYIWKILENLVDNFGVKWSSNFRRGCMIDLPKRFPMKQTLANNIRDQSLIIRGGRIFNALPHVIRNSTNISLDVFKSRLDVFLQQIPDTPSIPGMYPVPGSNDIVDWIHYLHLGDRRPDDSLVSLVW